MLEFKKICMEDKAIIKKYLKNERQYACEFTFGNNLLWDMEGLLEYVIVEDNLIYRMMYPDKSIYCVPDFHGRAKTFLDRIEADAGDCHRDYCITCLNKDMTEEMKNIYPDKFVYTFDAAHSDYIYLAEKLAALSGKKLHKKKNHWNYFVKNQEFVYEKITEKNAADCRKMKDIWCEKRLLQLPDAPETADERKSVLWESGAIDFALEHFEELGFTGGSIRIGGKIAAFTMGEPVNDRTFVVHFEKAYGEMNGLYTAINKLFVENELLGRYEYVNREEDMGIPGLRQAKLSYYPEFLYEKWVASPVK